MKILYDHQIFTGQRYGGISRYFYELMRHLPEGFEFEFPIILSNCRYIEGRDVSNHAVFFPDSEFRGQLRFMRTVNEMNTRRKIRQQDFDVFHPTYYSPYFLKRLKGKPYVITCYDLILEKYSARFPELMTDLALLDEKKLVLSSAAIILAISASTKKDLMEVYGFTSEKIEVIHLACSLPEVPFKRRFPGDYFLFVGSREGYKNFSILLDAASEILTQHPEISLICAGGSPFTTSEKALFNKMGIAKQIIQVPASDKDLVSLYTGALFFVFPSLYEGFGIPVLESFSCGCPAVLSNSSSLPELGGEAARYFDPEDRHSIFECLNKIVNEPDLRRQMKEEGFRQLKKFSWGKTAEATAAIYRTLK